MRLSFSCRFGCLDLTLFEQPPEEPRPQGDVFSTVERRDDDVWEQGRVSLRKWDR